MPELIDYACDVGSTRKGNFGWARVVDGQRRAVSGGTDIDTLAAVLRADLDSGHSLSLGIESPLFLPVPDRSGGLCRGRDGDGDRSCFASAGACVTALGLHELAFLLANLKREGVSGTTRWKTWEPAPECILLWEAFVSGRAKANPADAQVHVRDAATAAVSFKSALQEARRSGNGVRVVDGTPLSLVGAALLWSGWAKDDALLREDCLVVRPSAPCMESIGAPPSLPQRKAG